MIMLLIIILIICAIGGLPTWGYHNYGAGPSGIIGVILVIVLIFWLLGHRF